MALFSTENIGLITNKPDRCLKCGGKLRNRPPKDDKPRYRCQSPAMLLGKEIAAAN